MMFKPLAAACLLALLAACTPDRSLDTGTPHWAGEYRGGTTDDYLSTIKAPPPMPTDADSTGP